MKNLESNSENFETNDSDYKLPSTLDESITSLPLPIRRTKPSLCGESSEQNFGQKLSNGQQRNLATKEDRNKTRIKATALRDKEINSVLFRTNNDKMFSHTLWHYGEYSELSYSCSSCAHVNIAIRNCVANLEDCDTAKLIRQTLIKEEPHLNDTKDVYDEVIFKEQTNYIKFDEIKNENFFDLFVVDNKNEVEDHINLKNELKENEIFYNNYMSNQRFDVFLTV